MSSKCLKYGTQQKLEAELCIFCVEFKHCLNLVVNTKEIAFKMVNSQNVAKLQCCKTIKIVLISLGFLETVYEVGFM